MKNAIYLLIIFPLLFGCASKYIEPNDGPRAKITYEIAEKTNDLQIFLFDSYDCERPAMIYSAPETDTKQQHTTYVRANKKIINTFRALHAGYLSNRFYFSTIEFTPEEDSEYLIEISGDGFTDAKLSRTEISGESQPIALKSPLKVCTW